MKVESIELIKYKKKVKKVLEKSGMCKYNLDLVFKELEI